jgi:AraC-like DNA-binding protein
MNEKEICLRLQQQLCAFVKHMSIDLPDGGAQLNQLTERVVNNMHEVERYKLKRFLQHYNHRLKSSIQHVIAATWCDRRVLKAKNYIDENFYKEIKLPELAELVGLTSSTLSRLFQKFLATTFTNYLTNFRINKSIELLQKTDCRVTEIAYQCGFTSPRGFSRSFTKIKGVSPGTFRRAYRYGLTCMKVADSY